MNQPPTGTPLIVTFRDIYGEFTPSRPCIYRQGRWWLQNMRREVPVDTTGNPQAVTWRSPPPQKRP